MKKVRLGLLILFVTSLSDEPVAQQPSNLGLNTLPAHPNPELEVVGL